MKQAYKNYANRLLLSVLLSITAFLAVAQTQSITGRVTDKAAEGIPSATIVVKGTTTGVTTNVNGVYSILAKKGDVLVISCISYVSKEVLVTDATQLDIQLDEDDKLLDELVVVGYGTMKRSQITGSVSKLDNKVLETGVRSNPASALAGTIPGLRVAQTSGRPGAVPSIVLRGGTTYGGGGAPLVIVDGLLRNGFSEISQDDIESMEVLKDASATAIYGARANNGVILITTKKGKEGASNITLNAKVGVNTLNLPFEFLGAQDYIYWSRRAVLTSGQYEPGRLSQLNSVGPFGTGNLYKDANGNYYDGNQNASAVWSTMFLNTTNQEKLAAGWQTMTDPVPTSSNGAYDPNGTYKDLIFNDFRYADHALRPQSTTQDYNISMTGGNANGKYYAGLGYYNETGMPINTYYRRLTFLLNGEYRIKSWLTSTSSLNFADAKWRDAVTAGEGDYLGRMLGAPPTLRGVNENGELLVGRGGADGNPAVTDGQFIRRNNTDKFTLSQAFKVDFTQDLSLHLSGNLFYDEGHYESFNRDYISGPGSINVSRNSSASFGRSLSQTYNAVLNYRRTIARNHSLDVMAGSEYYDIYAKGLSASGSGAPTDDFMDLALTNNEAGRRTIDSYHDQQRILSFFGRVNYDYAQRYLLSLTVRKDGYSTLINNRWGTFPGVSAGWNLHNEEFLKPYFNNVLNTLKLRASYGANGNVSGISSYGLQGSYGTSRYDGQIGYLLSSLPFPNLRWESSRTVEFGFETSILDKVTLSAAFYKRVTEDKISSFNLPATSGITSLTTNNGSMQNQGLELDLNYRIFSNSDWLFSLSANAAFNRNKVLRLPFNGLPNNRQGGFEVYDPASGQVIFAGGIQEGQDPNVAYAYVADGLYRTQADLDALPTDYRDLSGNRVLLTPSAFNDLPAAQQNNYFPIALGDVKWKDLNGDNIIDYRDRAYMGRTVPSWTGGLGTYLKFKGLYLSTRWDYALGFVQFDGPRSWFLGNMQGTFNTTTAVFDTYTPENINARYPAYYWADQLYKNNINRGSSMFYRKGDYLALRDVTLGYNLPKAIAGKIGSEAISLNITGQNLTYFSKSTLFSPEVYGGQAIGGATGYPLPRTVIFGAQITF